MALNKLVIIIFLATVLLSSCSRQSTSNKDTNGYGYNQPKSTDPYAYNAKPEDPPAPPPPVVPDTVVTRDTIIIVQEPKPGPPDVEPSQTDDQFAQPEPWMRPVPGAYIAVKIKKTPCYGTCPTYTAAIFSDGTAFYYGERFVETIGYFEGRVNVDQLNTIIKSGYQNGFFNLANTYPLDGNYIVDLPTTILHLNSSINNKTVVNRGNAPEQLSVLQESVHVFLQSVQWAPIKK